MNPAFIVTVLSIAMEGYLKTAMMYVFYCRLMAVSKKLTSMDELMSCDPMYLGKVKTMPKSSFINTAK